MHSLLTHSHTHTENPENQENTQAGMQAQHSRQGIKHMKIRATPDKRGKKEQSQARGERERGTSPFSLLLVPSLDCSVPLSPSFSLQHSPVQWMEQCLRMCLCMWMHKECSAAAARAFGIRETRGIMYEIRSIKIISKNKQQQQQQPRLSLHQQKHQHESISNEDEEERRMLGTKYMCRQPASSLTS